MENKRPEAKGRGAQLDPPNRFGGPFHVLDLAEVEHDADYLESLRNRRTEYLPDRARSIVAENRSPDVGFRYRMSCDSCRMTITSNSTTPYVNRSHAQSLIYRHIEPRRNTVFRDRTR
jgi:hypothetical protein